MKLRTKLIVAFFTIILVPICIVFLGFSAFTFFQLRTVAPGYEGSGNGDLFAGNAVNLISGMTADIYEQIKWDATENPDSFENRDRLEQLNNELASFYSFLVVRRGDTFTYVGMAGAPSGVLDNLPEYGSGGGAGGARYFTDTSDGKNYLVKQRDFRDNQDNRCSVFIITALSQVLPQVRSIFSEMGLMLVLLLVMAALVLSMWIYRAIIRPLSKLQQATREIKKGNLDFELDITEQDEIGQLCLDFEEMRQRLKDTAEEKLQYDMENKELISNISHDLKTPITAIKGYCEGIMDGVASSPERMDKYIRTIYNKANDMDRLIDELTFYSKIDTNKIPYVFTKLDISTYFADCVEELTMELEAKNITLNFYNYVEPDTVIIADTEQLKRVVNNIVSNSVKYLDKRRGLLIIRLKDVGDFVQVEIEDNGRGISQKDLPNVFDRFFRADSSRNSAQGGSGIGLSIVKKIIEDHGGKIWATSKEGIGTVMHFVLRKYQEVLHE
ncbi:MAG: HAMP domain-containing histidine kinase [Lachnospiraceae bacterium]|jgi:signal transduction histidine kinase|nr:HAMP domain-containing histidine kinase [Lachnospiraceae bacterium]